jgi:predicted TIM-barrel fold metal-dependent hydrolase
MNALKLVLMLAAAGLAYQYWSTQQSANGPAVVSPNGFVMVPAMAGADPKQVVVFAPENCPSKKARRADELAHQLNAGGIPAVRTHHVSFVSPEKSPPLYANLNVVMDGNLPIVFVKGKGKGNPSFDQILLEYQGRR